MIRASDEQVLGVTNFLCASGDSEFNCEKEQTELLTESKG